MRQGPHGKQNKNALMFFVVNTEICIFPTVGWLRIQYLIANVLFYKRIFFVKTALFTLLEMFLIILKYKTMIKHCVKKL